MSTIEFFFEDIQAFSIHKNHFINHVNRLINNELKKCGDISIVFCSDKYLLDMNKQYLNHNYYTDIITFDYVQDNVISGDLFISFTRLMDNSETFDNELIKEVYRVVFHGVLHLLGYKDKTEDEKKLMTDKENYYLSEVDFSGKEI